MTFLSHINDVDTKCKSSVITFGLVNGIVCLLPLYKCDFNLRNLKILRKYEVKFTKSFL